MQYVQYVQYMYGSTCSCVHAEHAVHAEIAVTCSYIQLHAVHTMLYAEYNLTHSFLYSLNRYGDGTLGIGRPV